MRYYNYHSVAQYLIESGHLIKYMFVDNWNKIENCLVLFFDNHKPMPIRPYKIVEYLELLEKLGLLNKLCKN